MDLKGNLKSERQKIMKNIKNLMPSLTMYIKYKKYI